MKIAVTGGAGFVGSHVCDRLVADGHSVVVIDSLISGRTKNLDDVAERIEVLNADIADPTFSDVVPNDVDCIVHLAFPTPLCTRDRARQFHEVASTGTAQVLDWALASNAKVLYGSSISVYGIPESLPVTDRHPVNPMLVYGANKLHGEMLCRTYHKMYGLDFEILRISDVFGPRDCRTNAINNFISAAMSGSCVRLKGEGKQRRSYTYVTDIADVIAELAGQSPSNDSLNLAGPNAYSIRDVLETVGRVVGTELEIEVEPGTDPRDYVIGAERLNARLPEHSFTDLPEALASTVDFHRMRLK
jgi:nucleoside-diphosphate-sugar epimerase